MTIRYARTGTLALGAVLLLAGCGGGGDTEEVLGGVVGGLSRTASDEPRVRDIQGRDSTVTNVGNRDWSVDAGTFENTWSEGDREGKVGDVTIYTRNGGRDILRVDEDSLDHARFGSWLRTVDPEGEGAPQEGGGFVVSTSGTEAGDIPNSGTATYAGTVEGNYLTPTGAERLTGTLDATADFDARTVEATLDVAAGALTDTIDSGVVPIDVSTSLGSRVGTFETDTATSAEGFEGELGGSFYGSNGDEIGGTFNLTRGDERYLGAFGGG